jgi:hypothetical protein
MKYLKRFNAHNESLFSKYDESKRTESDILEEFKKWIIENIKYTDDDILYYFSEFTDTHTQNGEWEFQFQIEQRNNFKSILLEGRIDCYIQFTKEFSNLNSPETFIQLGEELKLFNVGYNQFKNLEEDIERINCKVDNSTFPITIEIEFEKVIPKEIIQRFKKEMDEVKEEQKEKSSDPDIYFGI